MKRTNISAFVLSSDKRLKVVKALLSSPIRLWSCSALEEMTELPHATVFRTIQGLRDFGILRGLKINRKDIAYELVRESPFLKALEQALSSSFRSVHEVVKDFSAKIPKEGITAVVLYGSIVSDDLKPESDIDILVILQQHHPLLEKNIFDLAAEISTKVNITLAVTMMTENEVTKEKARQFLVSVKKNHEVIYGKTPF